MSKVRLRPFFTYFGGKWRLSTRYPAPRCATIIEPFAGAAGYSLLYPEKRVWLNDLDPVIAGVWRYLIKATPREIRALPDDLTDSLPQEAQWLIRFWWAKGRTEPASVKSAWNRSGQFNHHTNFWGERVRERIASQVDWIKHWKITEREALSLPTGRKATWFVDPPYRRTGHRYPTSTVDFEALANWCRVLPGQVIACEQEGADWLPFTPLAINYGMYGYGRRRKTMEVVWTNGEGQ